MTIDSGRISARYARAIYFFAAGRGEESRLVGEMQAVLAKLAEFSDFGKALSNPTVSDGNKEELLFSAVGEEISESCRRAFGLIVGNGRASYMSSIALMYDKVYRREKRISSVKLTTVEPVSGAVERSLIGLLGITAGDSVDFEVRLDTELIGGFILRIGDRQLDASVRNQLNRLRLELTGG
ncbi:MAG: ATP synthase F1 subunit delta [Dysgonamonadaceae bacterium]|jgi:F-type H+-transporting ATPase subunit delta|nr:ATP synthase F1 subunit delta [Dysgonamonadaceae bacterium]